MLILKLCVCVCVWNFTMQLVQEDRKLWKRDKGQNKIHSKVRLYIWKENVLMGLLAKLILLK